MANPLASIGFILDLFKHTIKFNSKLLWKNDNPVFGAGIQTHDLLNMSLLP